MTDDVKSDRMIRSIHVKRVLVNGKQAKVVLPNFAEWEATSREDGARHHPLRSNRSR